MSEIPFFSTRMGMTFYQATMPRIADQLTRLNTNLEALVVEFHESNRLATEALRARSTPAIPSPGDTLR
jgi:hypothetical protein